MPESPAATLNSCRGWRGFRTIPLFISLFVSIYSRLCVNRPRDRAWLINDAMGRKQYNVIASVQS